MEALVVADSNGLLFVGKDFPAGGSSFLQQANKSDLREITKLLNLHPLEAPERDGNNPFDFHFEQGMSSYYNNQSFSEIRYTNSLMEQTLLRVKQQLRSEKLPGYCYIAIFQENPNVELGIDNTDEQIGFHVLIGYY